MKQHQTSPERGKQPDKVRITLDLSPDLNRTLEELVAKSGTNKSDVLRKAIALVEIAMEAKPKGLSLALSDKEDRVVTKIVGL
jgi:Arc/MetJ-type ribon-helix-helix transcriptional regulator